MNNLTLEKQYIDFIFTNFYELLDMHDFLDGLIDSELNVEQSNGEQYIYHNNKTELRKYHRIAKQNQETNLDFDKYVEFLSILGKSSDEDTGYDENDPWFTNGMEVNPQGYPDSFDSDSAIDVVASMYLVIEDNLEEFQLFFHLVNLCSRVKFEDFVQEAKKTKMS